MDKDSIGSLNLNEIANKQGLEVHIKSAKPEDCLDANLRRLKDKWLFFATLFLILLSIIGCFLFVAFFPNSKHLGSVINGGYGLVLALAGYYVRGKN